MAKGRGWRNRLLLLLAGITFTLLIVSGIMPNPFVPIWDWINRERPIAAEVEWQDRLGGRLSTAGMAGAAIAVDGGRQAQLRDRLSGDTILEGWTADWLTTAGNGSSAVVISGESFSRGYQVRDPATGAVVYDDEHARAVWGFREVWLDLHCEGPRSCGISAYQPETGRRLWTADLPGAGSGLTGVDPALANVRPGVPSRVHARADGPDPLPGMLGVPIDRSTIAVIDTRNGEVVAQPDAGSDELVMVAGDRVIRSRVARRDGVCQLSVSAHIPATGDAAWGPEPYNLRTITGGGCEQRRTATAYGAALVVVDPEGRDLVVDANDGRVLWRGAAEERVAGLTEDLAVIQGADPRVRYGVLLGGGGEQLWERTVDPGAMLVMAKCGVVVADRDPNRLHVWDPHTGTELLSVRTSASLLTCASDGIVLASGRSVGFAPFPGQGDPAADVPGGK